MILFIESASLQVLACRSNVIMQVENPLSSIVGPKKSIRRNNGFAMDDGLPRHRHSLKKRPVVLSAIICCQTRRYEVYNIQ